MGGPPCTEKASRRVVDRGGLSEYRGGPLNGGETQRTQEVPVHVGGPPRTEGGLLYRAGPLNGGEVERTQEVCEICINFFG